MSRFTLILGGAKSGKTSLALQKCEEYPAKRVYLATAQAFDGEMAERIRRHQAERGDEWRTVEEPFDPASAIAGIDTASDAVVLLDCLTLWLSNLMAGQGLSSDETRPKIEALLEAIKACPKDVIIVSNEVGHGIVPENKLARAFRDAAGAAHQILAARADEVIMVVAGLPMKLK